MGSFVTRRAALRALACGCCVGAMGFAGCKKSGSSSGGADSSAVSSDGVREGFSSDTEVKDYPVTLKVYADRDLSYCNLGDGLDPFDHYLAKYQAQSGRSDVDVQVEYLQSSELARFAAEGFPDGDALVATSPIVDVACSAQVAYAGAGGVSVRLLSYAFSMGVRVVRQRGSSAELPEAGGVGGRELSDGSLSRLSHLDSVEGSIAIANPETEPIGVAANKLLYPCGLYTEPDGISGTYADSLADKMIVYPSQDEAMAAVGAGECQFGFAFSASLASRYPHVQDCYTPPGATNTAYKGASLVASPEPGVARDFLQYMTMVTG
ncbi:MAG: substrate-binding domain-containing protein [Eggerthellaceae bacterium]|nr:substrate-binding domain-containing protein [Eggerthellaceae bacterium]